MSTIAVGKRYIIRLLYQIATYSDCRNLEQKHMGNVENGLRGNIKAETKSSAVSGTREE